MSYSVAEVKHSNPISNSNAAFSYDTSSNASTRRRAIVMVEKTSKAGLLTRRGENGAPIDKLIYSGKDLSHTIRGETLLERPRDAHLKKRIMSDSIPSKRRKSINRQLKPTWQIIRSLMKNVLLFAALLFLGLVIWRWATEAGRGVNPTFSTFNFDVRISEVELSLKETAKQFQVQMEIVDKKMGSEIGLLEMDVKKQIEERGAFIWNELKNLKDKTDDLAMSFSRLEDMNLLSKEKFGKLWNELKIRQRIDLDQIRALAREIVEKEIEKHAADGLGMVDYALASGGARVRKHSAPYAVGKPNSWLAAATFKSNIHYNAHKMLEPSFGEPGHCFALLGSSGFVEIRLRTEIIPEAVTLEHVSKSVAYDRSSAPKNCRVSGWLEGPNNDPSLQADKMLVLTEFTYDLEKSNAQTFPVTMAETGIINMVRLDFSSNHGNSALTCIYRFRVHGREPDPFLTVAK